MAAQFDPTQVLQDAQNSRLLNHLSLAVAYVAFGFSLFAFGSAQDKSILFCDLPIYIGSCPSSDQAHSSTPWVMTLPKTPVAQLLGGLFIFAGPTVLILSLAQVGFERLAIRSALDNQPTWLAPLLTYSSSSANIATFFGLFFTLVAIFLAAISGFSVPSSIALWVWMFFSFSLPLLLILLILAPRFRMLVLVAKGTRELGLPYRGKIYRYSKIGQII